MLDTMTRYLSAVGDRLTQRAVRLAFGPMVQRFGSCAINSAGLAIKTGGSTLAKTGSSDFYAVAGGTLVKIAASTDMPALTGLNIGAGKYNVICFLVDAAGTTSAVMGLEAATIGAIKWPQLPDGKALIGTLLITYASAFTGGTTALDTATTVYLNANGPFDPTIQP